VPLVADTHNVEYELLYRTYRESKDIFRKMYNGIEYLLTKHEEIASSKKFDVVLATSENDLRTFRRDLPNQKMYVIPNGVDIEFFSSQTAEPEPNSIVFTGLMSYFPNDHGIQFFLKEIFPFVLSKVPDATVTIVGADPSREVLRLVSNNVHVTGYVGDVRPYFNKALVAIVPLLVGGGTRLKVLEAMAMRKPVVSTTLGCEGLDVQHGHSVLLADTSQEYADAIVELFRNEKLRHKLQQNAYEIVESTYDWKTIGTQLQRVFEELNADKPRAAVEIQHLVSQ
jgi:glycosyltransferase involved in cell wall biosynthesis